MVGRCFGLLRAELGASDGEAVGDGVIRLHDVRVVEPPPDV